jgi:hypothetical protein
MDGHLIHRATVHPAIYRQNPGGNKGFREISKDSSRPLPEIHMPD